MGHIWLRVETKVFEKRTPLTPKNAKKLLAHGHQVTVERSTDRIFINKEYAELGCEMVPAGSWETDAPKDSYILGLKELPDLETPATRKHIYFAHCFKDQEESKNILEKFKKGGGVLYDLEFLKDGDGKRIAAFGYWAGYAGAAVNLMIWLERKKGLGPPYKIRKSFDNNKELLLFLGRELEAYSERPDATIFGASGRCGSGVVALFKKLGLSFKQFNRADTKDKGWFTEIISYSMMFNCIYLNAPIFPILTKEMLQYNKKLMVVGDISCDPNNSINPIPIYNSCTTFDNPTHRVELDGLMQVDVMSIDHLPTLLPRESSIDFSDSLFPHLCDFLTDECAPVWEEAKKYFVKGREADLCADIGVLTKEPPKSTASVFNSSPYLKAE